MKTSKQFEIIERKQPPSMAGWVWYRCLHCGFTDDSPPPPHTMTHPCKALRYGPGDYIALWLANWGITKWKYLEKKAWLYAKLGLPVPRTCGCDKRIERINSLWLDLTQAYHRIRNLIGV